MRDAEGCCHGRVLGGVEITEIESGDNKVWVADWVVGDEVVIHDGGRKGRLRVLGKAGGKGGGVHGEHRPYPISRAFLAWFFSSCCQPIPIHVRPFSRRSSGVLARRPLPSSFS